MIGFRATWQVEVAWSDESSDEAGFLIYRVPVFPNCRGGLEWARTPVEIGRAKPGRESWSGRFSYTVMYEGPRKPRQFLLQRAPPMRMASPSLLGPEPPR